MVRAERMLNIQGFSILPRTERGITWVDIKDEPAKLLKVIEEETQLYIEAGNKLTFKGLMASRRADLSHAIQRYYPSGLHGIKEHFGIPQSKKSRGYSNIPNPKKIIREEAEDFLKTHGTLGEKELRTKGNSSLKSSAEKYYPGGWRVLREKLGSPVRPMNKRSIDDIRNEAKEFAEREGSLTTQSLSEGGKNDLLMAIVRRYPGKITQLRTDLGLEMGQRRNKYWKDVTNIENAAVEFFQTNGNLNMGILQRTRSDLWIAIGRYYPGGIRALREKFGIPDPKKEAKDISIKQAQEDLWGLLEVQK